MSAPTKRGYRLGRICPCGNPVSDSAKNGVRKPCFVKRLLADPNRAAKVSASLKRRLADPEAYAAHLERSKRAGKTKSRDLELCARLAANMRDNIQPRSMTPECVARRDFALLGKLSGLSKLSWCPPEFLDEYRDLTGDKRSGRTRMKAAEARALIEAKMSDLAAVRSGELGNAVFFLSRFTSIRKNDDGTYRYGTAVLTAGELMKRALAKGFAPAFSNQWIDRLAA